MARRPLRQLVREARQAEQSRHARRHEPDSYDGWLAHGLSSQPDDFTRNSRLSFDEASQELTINFDFPSIDAVEGTPLDERRSVYLQLLAEMTLRCVHHCLAQDAIGAIQSVSFSGYVDTIDLSTGHEIRPRLLQAEFSRAQFEHLDLARVDPVACIKGLNAEITLNSENSSFWAI